MGMLAPALPTSQGCRELAKVRVVEEPVNLIKMQSHGSQGWSAVCELGLECHLCTRACVHPEGKDELTIDSANGRGGEQSGQEAEHMGSDPVLPQAHRVTSGKSQALSGPQCPPVYNG